VGGAEGLSADKKTTRGGGVGGGVGGGGGGGGHSRERDMNEEDRKRPIEQGIRPGPPFGCFVLVLCRGKKKKIPTAGGGGGGGGGWGGGGGGGGPPQSRSSSQNKDTHTKAMEEVMEV